MNMSKRSEILRSVAGQELEFCPDFTHRAERHEAWWHQETAGDGNPLLLGYVNSNPSRPVTKRFELLDEPDDWLEAKLRDLGQLAPAADAVPQIRLDFGPCSLAALMGRAFHFEAETSWTPAFIRDDWSNAPEWGLERSNHWWKVLETLLPKLAKAAHGRFLVNSPNLGGLLDLLSVMRGQTELCMDLMDQPETVGHQSAALLPVYREARDYLYDTVLNEGAGLIHWHNLWSDEPYMIAECDFAYSVGPAEWERICGPDVESQSRLAPRCVFHLDGDGMTRHIEALLDIPTIQAIQFTPGDCNPSALPWLDMYKRIQQRGKSLLIFVKAPDVVALTKELKPEGLAFQIEGVQNEAHFENLHREVRRCLKS